MTSTNIVVLDGYTVNPGDNSWSELQSLGNLTVYARTAPGEVIERARNADIILTNKTPLRANELKKLERLRFISVLATGYNIVDTDATRALKIPVANVPAYGTNSVAQHVIALILALTNRVAEHAGSVCDGDWCRCPDFCYWKTAIVELQDLNLGIVGFGKIGRRVAQLGHALGMRILRFSPDERFGDPACFPGEDQFSGISIPYENTSKNRFFSQADVVSLHCPLTTGNVGFINRDVLCSMKRSAYLVNTARGALINEDDLAEALAGGIIAGAALDVISTEPPAPDNPLIGARNCMITPHIAWSSLNARRRLLATTARNIRAFIQGSPENIINNCFETFR
jgi:glycerate dehydrogenase